MNRNRNSGVTLIELLIVISIIGILVVALGISYANWRGNYRIESQIKNIYSDLMEARTKAITRNVSYFTVINASNYQICGDANSNGICDAGPPPEDFQQKKIEYGFQLAMISSDVMPITVNFDTKGLMSLSTRGLAAPASFRIDITGTGLTPDYDCIVLYQASIKTGKYDSVATKCVIGN